MRSLPPAPSGQSPPVGPVPPDLHWALVLLLGMVTGLFTMIWTFVQARFAKKIDPASKATMLYIVGIVLVLAGMVLGFGYLVATAPQLQTAGEDPASVRVALVVYGVMLILMLGGSIVWIVGAFNIRSSMVRHYNSIEPINLRMSGVMTFFFNILYIQYHMSRIAKWKETGFLIPQ